jgi:hypothetical protein
MFKYRVFDSQTEGGRVALRDAAGRIHVARALSEPPLVGTVLAGTRPHLGYGLLFSVESGEMFRLLFETIDCGRKESLHALLGLGRQSEG